MLEVVALVTGDYVDVEVVDDLTSVLAIVHVDVYAIGLHGFFYRVSDLAYGFLRQGPCVGRCFEDVRYMLFRDDERVTLAHRLDREE